MADYTYKKKYIQKKMGFFLFIILSFQFQQVVNSVSTAVPTGGKPLMRTMVVDSSGDVWADSSGSSDVVETVALNEDTEHWG